jgi:hypothetical protein
MDTAKVQIKRITREIDEVIDGKPTGKKVRDPDSVVTGISYLDSKDGSRYEHLALDENKNEFELTADQAAAAVKTGGFVVSESSKSEIEE